jgi:uncharacterized membrane protein
MLLSGIGLGAALMYVFDPEKGRRRRALARDRLASAACRSQDFMGVLGRDLTKRSRGVLASARSILGTGEASDHVLTERVRSEIGRVVSHPHALQVEVTQGRVTLRGPVLEREADELVDCVKSVRGVGEVEDHLERHSSAEHISALQGGRTRSGYQSEFMQEQWSPTARFVAGAAGGALALYSVRYRNPLSAALGAIGIGILARGLTNLELKRLVGVGIGPRAVDVEKTIRIAAPIEQVFEFWTRPENFPNFMRNVRNVTGNSQGTTHWVINVAAGMTMEWDAECTEFIPNQQVAWRTLPGAIVEHAGSVRFEPTQDGGTRVDLKMSYNPPAGAIGHALASFLGADPKKKMDEDLMRMKTMLETGRPPRDAAARRE